MKPGFLRASLAHGMGTVSYTHLILVAEHAHNAGSYADIPYDGQRIGLPAEDIQGPGAVQPVDKVGKGNGSIGGPRCV